MKQLYFKNGRVLSSLPILGPPVSLRPLTPPPLQVSALLDY